MLSRFTAQRLEAEEIRDAMLAAYRPAQLKAGGPSVIMPMDKRPGRGSLQTVAMGGDRRPLPNTTGAAST